MSRSFYRWSLALLLVMTVTSLPMLAQYRTPTPTAPDFRCVFQPVAIGGALAGLIASCSTIIACAGGFFAITMGWWDTVALCHQ